MKTRQHVESFLAPISPAYSIRKFAKSVISAAENDNEIASLLDAIQVKLNDSDAIISEKHSDIFDRIRTPAAIPYIPTAPDWIRPAIAAAYLRARSNVERRTAPVLGADLKAGLRKVLSLVDNVEPDFIGELLVETTLAAREDSEFSAKLKSGAAEFRALVDETYSSIDPSSTKSTALAAAAPSTGGSSGSCRICRRSGGTQQCAPTSCWVIVVIIIIIIVTK